MINDTHCLRSSTKFKGSEGSVVWQNQISIDVPSTLIHERSTWLCCPDQVECRSGEGKSFVITEESTIEEAAFQLAVSAKIRRCLLVFGGSIAATLQVGAGTGVGSQDKDGQNVVETKHICAFE